MPPSTPIKSSALSFTVAKGSTQLTKDVACQLRTCLVQEPRSKDGFRLLPVEDHAGKLHTVAADIQQAATPQVLLHTSGDGELQPPKFSLKHHHVPNRTLAEQGVKLLRSREEASPQTLEHKIPVWVHQEEKHTPQSDNYYFILLLFSR